MAKHQFRLDTTSIRALRDLLTNPADSAASATARAVCDALAAEGVTLSPAELPEGDRITITLPDEASAALDGRKVSAFVREALDVAAHTHRVRTISDAIRAATDWSVDEVGDLAEAWSGLGLPLVTTVAWIEALHVYSHDLAAECDNAGLLPEDMDMPGRYGTLAYTLTNRDGHECSVDEVVGAVRVLGALGLADLDDPRREGVLAAVESLDDLGEALRESGEALSDRVWVDLPTFGGDEPEDTAEVWSWDAARLLVGTCADDLEIVDREEWPNA